MDHSWIRDRLNDLNFKIELPDGKTEVVHVTNLMRYNLRESDEETNEHAQTEIFPSRPESRLQREKVGHRRRRTSLAGPSDLPAQLVSEVNAIDEVTEDHFIQCAFCQTYDLTDQDYDDEFTRVYDTQNISSLEATHQRSVDELSCNMNNST